MADDRFYVKTLTLENFRCFEKAELGPFDPHFNLLVGENGTGKSSVLVALADLFRILGDFRQSDGSRRLINADDMRFEYYSAPNGVVTQKVHTNIRLESMLVDGETEHRVQESGHESGRAYTSDRTIPDGVQALISLYRTERAFKNPTRQEAGGVRSRRRRETALREWDNADVATDDLREWFKLETLSALQSLARESHNDGHYNGDEIRLLKLVVDAIISAVPEARKIEYDANLEDIIVEDENNIRHEFRHMSDGQRAFVGLVADIARRVCVLNAPVLGNEALLRSPGLVLIDEIDLHLHPKWQRQIVPALKKVFPKIQFFATTHSPQVIGECKPEEIVLLTKDGQQKRPSGSYGMDSNWILECVMEAEGRDPEIAKRIAALFDLIDDGRFEDARAELASLRELLGLDPKLVAAESYLWNLEHGADEAAE